MVKKQMLSIVLALCMIVFVMVGIPGTVYAYSYDNSTLTSITIDGEYVTACDMSINMYGYAAGSGWGSGTKDLYIALWSKEPLTVNNPNLDTDSSALLSYDGVIGAEYRTLDWSSPGGAVNTVHLSNLNWKIPAGVSKVYLACMTPWNGTYACDYNIEIPLQNLSYHTLTTDKANLNNADVSLTNNYVKSGDSTTVSVTPSSGAYWSIPPTMTATNGTVTQLNDNNGDGVYAGTVSGITANSEISISGQAYFPTVTINDGVGVSDVKTNVTGSVTGNITSGTNVSAGETITVTPGTPAANYNFKEVKYNDGTEHLLTASDGKYIFIMPNKQVTISVTYGPALYDAAVIINKDSALWTSGAPDIVLSTSNTSITAGSVVTGTFSNGVYTFRNIASGTDYYIWDKNSDLCTRQIIQKDDNAKTVNYYTISVGEGSNISGAYVGSAGKSYYVGRENTTINISAGTPQLGYTWDKWTVSGVTPSDFDPTTTAQSFTITGKSAFTANVTAIPATAPTLSTTDAMLTYNYANGNISVTATPALGHKIKSYQWYDNGTNNSTVGGTKITSNGTSDIYTIPIGKSVGTYYYYCEVTTQREDNSQTKIVTTTPAASVTINRTDSAITIAAKQSKIFNNFAITAGKRTGDIQYNYSGDSSTQTVKWYLDNSGTRGSEISAPTDAGVYWIGVSATQGANYNEVDEQYQKFMITKALPASFTATEGTDTNLITSLNRLTGMDEAGITLTIDSLASSNANVANDGQITYTSSQIVGDVIVKINKADGTEQTQTISVTVPAHTKTAAELANEAIDAAKLLLPASFTATEGIDTNLLTTLNALTGMAATGVTLTIDSSASSNANVANDGQITYTNSQIVGDVIVKINKADGTEQTQTISVTVPAHDTYKITGNIKDENSNDVGGVVVKLMAGSRQIAQAITDINGRFTITGVSSGIYNLVISKGTDQIITLTITVSDSNIATGSISLPKGNKNSAVEIKANTPDIIVDKLNDFFDSSKFTKADSNVISAGGTVEIKLTVEKRDESGDNAAANADSIKAAAGSGKEIGMFLNLAVSKIVTPNIGTGNSTPIVELDKVLIINIPLPIELQGKSNYIVYRYHCDAVDVITQTPNADGEYIELSLDGKFIRLHAKKFSTYALAYTAASTPIIVTVPDITVPDITTDVTAGGKITISTDKKTATIIPDDGYVVTDVLVDGKSVGAADTYTFTDNSNHKISAVFSVKPVNNILDNNTDDKNKIIETFTQGSRLPYYLEQGKKVFIGFSASAGNILSYIAPKDVSVSFAENPKKFIDVDNSWAKTNINFVTEREIFLGTGTDEFSPNIGMTRAMFVAVIGRMYERSYGTITDDGNNTFSDVNTNDYYAKYVEWANKNGIIKGIGDNKFATDTVITREQMAAIMFNFAKYLDKEPKDSLMTNVTYTDKTDIAQWAMDSAAYCQKTSIITGRDGGKLAPKATATRAEVAAVIERFVKTILK